MYMKKFSDLELLFRVERYREHPDALARVRREIRLRQQKKGPWDIDPMWTPS